MWGRHQERSKDNSNCTQITEAMVIKYGTPGSNRRNNQKSTAICDLLPVQERVDVRGGKTLLRSGGAAEHLIMPPGLLQFTFRLYNTLKKRAKISPRSFSYTRIKTIRQWFIGLFFDLHLLTLESLSHPAAPDWHFCKLLGDFSLLSHRLCLTARHQWARPVPESHGTQREGAFAFHCWC